MIKSKKCQENASRIVNYYTSHQNDRPGTVKHFRDEGLKDQTIRDVLNRWTDEQRVDYDLKSGPRPTVLTKPTLRKIKNRLVKTPSTCSRRVARSLGISEKSVRRAKSKLAIRSRKKISAPKFVKNQEARCKKNGWKLYKRVVRGGAHRIVVMDDETAAGSSPGPRQRLLLWDRKSSSKSESEIEAKSGDVYKKKCLPRLDRFIKSLGDRENTIFWPDMASCHYRADVIEDLRKRKIEVVSKVDNLPNCPIVRPVEK